MDKNLEEFDQLQRKSYNRGRALVIMIAVLNIAGAYINYNISTFIINAGGHFNYNILTSLIRICWSIAPFLQIILSIVLFSGKSWVKFLFASGAVLGVFCILYLLVDFGGHDSYTLKTLPANPILSIKIFYNLIFYTASSILMFSNKSISAYMYTKANG